MRWGEPPQQGEEAQLDEAEGEQSECHDGRLEVAVA
jgi:hypothetical protein